MATTTPTRRKERQPPPSPSWIVDRMHVPLDSLTAHVPIFPIPDNITAESLDPYRKEGPGGKLHNLGVYLNRSSQLKMAFEKAQLATGRKEPLAWLQNVATRWESDEAMFSRALLLQDAIKQMFHDLEGTWEQSCGNVADRPPVLNERLTSQEWKVVGIIQKILQPTTHLACIVSVGHLRGNSR
ncbi:Ribonuclease H-like protein [Apiospora kogelbergensis]|uniref:Ribonuclease H-like protein n=1 Tax=Apiospora kogelbergensis TaxID=1337665 RepID=A0AAW0QZE0_9PEZI